MRFDGLSYTVWLNGVAYGSVATGYPISSVLGTNNNFGKSQYGSDAYFQGSFDEIAAWNVALSQNELLNIYNRQVATYAGTYTSRAMDTYATQNYNSIAWNTTLPFYKPLPGMQATETSSTYANIVNGLETSILASWHFEERELNPVPGGYDVNDDTGNQQFLNCDNAMAYNTLGLMGSTLAMNGVSCGGANASSAANPISVSAWFKTAAATGGEIIDFGDTPYASANQNDITQGLYMTDGGSIVFGIYANNTQQVAASTSAYTDDRWHHVLGTASATAMNLYIDGAQVGSTTTISSPSTYTGYWNVGSDAIANTSWAGAPSTNNFAGLIDEAAAWNRELSPSEAQQLWRRGANRLKLQVRRCPDSACATTPWAGPDGTSTSYFSEILNRTGGNVLASAPTMTFGNFNMNWTSNRYFQYRAIFESDDVNARCSYSGANPCSPELQAVVVSPNHYDSTLPTVSNSNTVAFHNLTGFTSTTSCSAGVTFQISPDNVNWYYYTGAAWALAAGTQSSTTASINSHIGTFATSIGTGNVYFKAFLGSNGATTCTLSDVQFTGTQ